MEKDTTVTQKESQIMVSYAMDNITKASRTALSEYLQEKYLESFAKVVIYLGEDSEESHAFLQKLDNETKAKGNLAEIALVPFFKNSRAQITKQNK